MTALRPLAIAACVALAPGLAAADGFYTRDLGDGGAPAECMARAQQAIQAYVQQSGTAASVLTGTWSVDAYDLAPGNVDVELACPYRDSHVTVALLVTHSSGSEQERVTVLDGITAFWNSPGGAPAGK